MQRRGPKAIFLYLFVFSVGTSALIGAGVILFGNLGEFETMVLLTALTVTVTSILGLSCGALLETRRSRLIPLVGIVLALVSAVMWIYLIWKTIHNDIFVKTLMSATLIVASCAHISLVSLAKLERKFLWSRMAIHAAVWSMAAYLLFLIWNPNWIDDQISGRIIGVLSIIIAALTVLTPIFHKLSPGEQSATEIDGEIERLRARITELEATRESIANDLPPSSAEEQ